MQQDVVRLDVSVHNITSGQHFEGLEHLPEEEQRFLFRKRCLFLHQLVHSPSVAVLVDEVEVVGCLQHIDVLHYVGTVLQVRQDVDFIYGAFLQFGDLFEFLCLDHLDGNFLLGDHVDGFVDLGIDSLTQLLLELVVFNYFSHSYITDSNITEEQAQALSSIDIFKITSNVNLNQVKSVFGLLQEGMVDCFVHVHPFVRIAVQQINYKHFSWLAYERCRWEGHLREPRFILIALPGHQHLLYIALEGRFSE